MRLTGILVAEPTLRYSVVRPDAMRAQLDRLVSAVGLHTIRFGAIPLNRRMPAMPMHGYQIDDDVATVENIITESRITDRDQVTAFNKLSERLCTVARRGQRGPCATAAHVRRVRNRTVDTPPTSGQHRGFGAKID